MSKGNPQTCKHTALSFNPSSYSAIAGYKHPTARQRAAATTRSGHVKAHQDVEVPDPGTYPAPLVLPGDDLAFDPTYPPQSLGEWLSGEYRNPVTAERKTIYVAAPPAVDPGLTYVREWCRPGAMAGAKGKGDLSPPDIIDVIGYLQAFYHGMHVKLLPSSKLRFAAWEDENQVEPLEESSEPPPKRVTKKGGKAKSKSKSKSKPKIRSPPPFIALQTPTEAIRIRTRLTPATEPPSPYAIQLNLSDLLDATIALPPPPDAYALLLLVNHDLYEDEDDDFVCGRAYGGSRVAVVSTARYDPRLDALQDVFPRGEEHAWPGSCCAAFMKGMCDGGGDAVSSSTGVRSSSSSRSGLGFVVARKDLSPMGKAIAAAAATSQSEPQNLTKALWLLRVCKTASHELGHCFGMDHCVYFACVMQGTAGLAEDARQPPYLCPVDEIKLAVAVAGVFEAEAKADTVAGIGLNDGGTVAGVGANSVQQKGGKKKNMDKMVGRKRRRGVEDDGGRDVEMGTQHEMGNLEVWKRERIERLRGFCQEMTLGGAGGVMSFWKAFDAWLEGVAEVERTKRRER